jgi:hypothetical protein
MVEKSSWRTHSRIALQGNAQALTDLLGGHVSIMFSALPSAIAHIGTNRVRRSQSRAKALGSAQVPTFIESSVPDFVFSSEFGLLDARAHAARSSRLNRDCQNPASARCARAPRRTGCRTGRQHDEYAVLLKADPRAEGRQGCQHSRGLKRCDELRRSLSFLCSAQARRRLLTIRKNRFACRRLLRRR